MTKLFTTLLGLSLVAMPAMAISVEKSEVSKKALTLETSLNLNYAPQVEKAVSNNQPAKKFGNTEEMTGAYTWTGIGQLTSNGGKTVTMSLYMESGSTATEVIFALDARPEAPLKATVDFANSTFTVKKQTMEFNTNYSTNEYFYIAKMVPTGEPDKYQLQEEESVTATLTEDNKIVFPSDYCLGIGLVGETGWFWLTSSNEWAAPDYFKYNASEWADAGTADYYDAWINPILTNPIQAYPVNLQVNKANPNKYLIVNPYGAETPWAQPGLNYDPNQSGYIVFNAEDKNFIYLDMLVFCGLTLDMSDAQDGSELQSYYPFNIEGSYIDQGFTVQEAFDEMEWNDQLISSWEGDEITICNPYFGLQTAPTSPYWWIAFENSEWQAKLSNIKLSGVDQITVDNSNAPVKYYNLQGVEVANPEAGMIVIKKQGTKATKYVVK